MRVGYLRDDEANYEAIVIADDETDTENFISIQRAFRFDEQDRRLGMDTYCLVHGGTSYYGGVHRWELKDEVLTLEVDEAAAVELGLETVVQLSVDDGQLISRHLGRLLGQSPP